MSSLTGADDDKLWEILGRVLASIPHEGNRDVVLTYLQERRAKGIKPATLGVDANALRGFCLHIGQKALEDVTKQDIISYVNHAKQVRRWRNSNKEGAVTVTEKAVRLSPSTLNKRKEILKPFFRWLRGLEDEDPPEVKGLKSRKGDGDMIPTDALISREDLQAMLQAHPDPQDKAKIAVLYESGFRASEFCALNLGSVAFDQYGAVLTLPKGGQGLKTGARRVRLFDSVPYLLAWFENHPFKGNAKAPLFVSMSHRAPRARLTPGALWYFCHQAATRAGLQKEIHPHLFRHSRATECARLGWNEAQMRAYFGWARGSDMPSRYVHLAGLDYEHMELERRGLLGEGDRSRPALTPLKCRVCKVDNLPTATFCQACRNPVSPAAEEEIERRRQDEIKEAAARMVQGLVKDQVAAALRDALGGQAQGT